MVGHHYFLLASCAFLRFFCDLLSILLCCFFFIAVKPTEVRIRQLSAVLVANKEAKFECSTSGSRPRAHLYWLFDGQRHETALSGEHQTSTVITLNLKQLHNGATLGCVAENLKIANSSISDELTLDVQCKCFSFMQTFFLFNRNNIAF